MDSRRDRQFRFVPIATPKGMVASVTQREIQRFLDLYAKWSRRELTQASAASRLEMGERTFRRYVSRYTALGIEGLEDRRVSSPGRRAPAEETAKVVRLYAERFPSCSVLRFYRDYQREHAGERSYTWVKNCLQEAGLVRKRPRRDTECKARQRESAAGILLHNCVSRYSWLPSVSCDLTLMIDDATNRVYSGFLSAKHDVWCSFRSIRETVLAKGLFRSMTADWLAKHRGTPAAKEVKRAMENLGSTIVWNRSPHAQTRCDRIIHTLETCLPWTLAEHGIGEAEDGNVFLSQYWAKFNELIAVGPSHVSQFMRLGNNIARELDNVFCVKRSLTIDRDATALSMPRHLNVILRSLHLSNGTEIRVHQYEDGSLAVYDGRCALGRCCADGRLLE